MHPAIHPMGLLEPFISAHALIVVPVMVFLADVSVLDLLKPHDAEVAHIFSHPLEAVLEPSLVTRSETLVESGSEDWKYPEELHVRFWHLQE